MNKDSEIKLNLQYQSLETAVKPNKQQIEHERYQLRCMGWKGARG